MGREETTMESLCSDASKGLPPLDIGINGRAAIVTASIRSAKPTKRMQCLHCAAVASTRTCSVGWPIWAREARPLVFGSVLSARAARCVSTDASKRAYSNPSAARRRQLPLHRGALCRRSSVGRAVGCLPHEIRWFDSSRLHQMRITHTRTTSSPAAAVYLP